MSRTRSRDVDIEALTSSVAERLRRRGERMTNPRRVVLAVLAQRGGHMAAEELVAEVARVDARVHRASVYRVLEAFAELGVVQHVHVGHGATAYHLADAHGPHLHVQCRHCGGVQDAPPGLLDDAARRLADRLGFELDPGHVALSGTCRTCRTSGRIADHPHTGDTPAPTHGIS